MCSQYLDMENTFYLWTTHSIFRAIPNAFSFYIRRTHSTLRELILYMKNTFYIEKTHSTYALGDDSERFLSLLHQEWRHHCSNCDAWFRVWVQGIGLGHVGHAWRQHCSYCDPGAVLEGYYEEEDTCISWGEGYMHVIRGFWIGTCLCVTCIMHTYAVCVWARTKHTLLGTYYTYKYPGQRRANAWRTAG